MTSYDKVIVVTNDNFNHLKKIKIVVMDIYVDKEHKFMNCFGRGFNL